MTWGIFFCALAVGAVLGIALWFVIWFFGGIISNISMNRYAKKFIERETIRLQGMSHEELLAEFGSPCPYDQYTKSSPRGKPLSQTLL